MNQATPFLGHSYVDADLIIGLVCSVGTDLSDVTEQLVNRLKYFNYKTIEIKVSEEIIPQLINLKLKNIENDEYIRISSLMNAGNDAREISKDNSILALGVAARISQMREKIKTEKNKRLAFIVKSLKHPAEVAALREIYHGGFYLLGVYSDIDSRKRYLTKVRYIDEKKAEDLISRDADEHKLHGQRTRDTFHLSDFFIPLNDNIELMKRRLWRVLDILFGHPYKTPTFDEFAMFMAFSASLRSADLSRQVGAVIAKENQILAFGANDCPKYGGGLYWPDFGGDIEDAPEGRDFKLGFDSNQYFKTKIMDDIVSHSGLDDKEKQRLSNSIINSQLQDITEYGRVVHAEMEALLSCARSTINTQGGVLYCTTFPCHNCAKHIVASGIKRVVYVEPYPKSKTEELLQDSVTLSSNERDTKVLFEPFVGIGPRKFFDLFSMHLGSGIRLIRKTAEGKIVDWKPKNALLRMQMLPASYLDLELEAVYRFVSQRKGAIDGYKK